MPKELWAVMREGRLLGAFTERDVAEKRARELFDARHSHYSSLRTADGDCVSVHRYRLDGGDAE